MMIELKKLSSEKWEISSCKCGEDPIVFDTKINQNDGHDRSFVIQCPECGRRTSASYRYHYDELDFIAARYRAAMIAITKWEHF